MARSITDEPDEKPEQVTGQQLMMALEVVYEAIKELEAKVDALSVQKGL